jgi:WD40 repeat protein
VLKTSEGCDDKRLRIYESEKGTLLFGPFELHSHGIRSLAWSPDGQRYVLVILLWTCSRDQRVYTRIVTGSDDRKVKVVAVDTGQIIYEIALHNDCVRTVLYAEEFFISASDDRQAHL